MKSKKSEISPLPDFSGKTAKNANCTEKQAEKPF